MEAVSCPYADTCPNAIGLRQDIERAREVAANHVRSLSSDIDSVREELSTLGERVRTVKAHVVTPVNQRAELEHLQKQMHANTRALAELRATDAKLVDTLREISTFLKEHFQGDT